MDFVKSVIEFNKLAGTEEKYDERMLSLYVGLILEELQELIRGLGISGPQTYEKDALENLLFFMSYTEKLFKENRYVGRFNPNHKEILDGAIDVAVVAIGAAISNGSDASGAANEICGSNMSKAIEVDGVLMMMKDSNGKIIKPETYRKPNIDPFVTKKNLH